MIKVYGIPNCNSVKKALDWLKQNKIAFEFHDYKKLGIDKATLTEWTNTVGREVLVNKKGTTWKALDAEVQQSVTNDKAAIQLMLAKNSVIKRPVIVTDKEIMVGFDEELYRSKLLSS